MVEGENVLDDNGDSIEATTQNKSHTDLEQPRDNLVEDKVIESEERLHANSQDNQGF